MIVVDSSALIAILLNEPGRDSFENVLSGVERCVISAVNAHEMATVLRLRGRLSAVERFWQKLIETDLEIVPFDEAQVRAAALALSSYSKARLNLVDCATYALAKSLNAPLLFNGNDFAQTDLQSCL